MLRFARRAGAVLVVAASCVLLGANSASAAGNYSGATIYQGSDYASFGHGRLDVCDVEQDGNGVYADVTDAGGSHFQIWDGDGSSGGCDHLYDSVTVFRVCEDALGPNPCSDWVHVGGGMRRIYQGSDYAAFYPSDNLYACDNERDGHGVYAEYRSHDGAHGNVWDHNGSASGCGVINSDVWKFRVCEDVAGPNYCSDWVTTWDFRVGD